MAGTLKILGYVVKSKERSLAAAHAKEEGSLEALHLQILSDEHTRYGNGQKMTGSS